MKNISIASARNQEPGTRNQEPGTRNQEPGTRNQGTRNQGTGNREQGTGNREQGTGNREQGARNREQGTNYEGYAMLQPAGNSEGENDFAATLVDRYYSRARVWLAKMVGSKYRSHVDVEQIANDAVLELFRFVQSRSAKSMPRLSLIESDRICYKIAFRIVAQSIRDLGRLKRREQLRLTSLNDDARNVTASDCEEVVSQVIANELMDIAELRLHPSEYLVFTMRAEGYSVSEIASAIELPPKKLNSMLGRIERTIQSSRRD